MLKIRLTSKFKRDYKTVQKRPYFNEEEFKFVVGELAAQKQLPVKYRDHELNGKRKEFKNCRECHINPDWLLIYKVEKESLVLYLLETGSHSDLF